jgi:cyclophilin family peptidyl-prolyl cis-trans isomerase
MRRTLISLRSAKGYGWYNKFMKTGQEGFLKNSPPTAFNWDKKLDLGRVSVAPRLAPGGSIENEAETSEEAPNRRKAFFEMSVDDKVIGKLVFELADEVVPVTVQNFVNLCTGAGKFNYANTNIHTISKGIALMGGDVEANTGKMSHSSYTTRYLQDENFIIPHSQRGLLSMASVGRNTNGSQFYISLSPTTHLNGKCTVFGRLVEGEEVLNELENIFTVRLAPVREIKIASAGLC